MGLVPKPPIPWVIFRIPGWLWVVGVLLSGEGVILPAKGVPWADTLNSLAALSCRCLTGHLSRASWQLEMSPKFPGHLSIISWMNTWISWNCSWMRHHPDSYTGCILVAGSWMLRVVIWLVPMDFYGVHPLLYWHAQSFLPIFSVWPIFSIICEKESSWIFTGIIFRILD